MKRILLTLFIAAIAFSSTASSFDGFSTSFTKEASGGDIVPHRYKGYTYKDMLYNARYSLGRVGFVAGVRFNTFLNSSYGMLLESGQLKSKPGGSLGANFYQLFPFFITAEYSVDWDKFGDHINMNKSFAGYLSLATFPWFYKGGGVILPNIGIGLQHSSIGPEWALSNQVEKDPKDEVSQVLYKVGLIINIPVNGDQLHAIQLIGNYYRSLFTKNQPHAMNAFSICIGFCGF